MTMLRRYLVWVDGKGVQMLPVESPPAYRIPTHLFGRVKAMERQIRRMADSQCVQWITLHSNLNGGVEGHAKPARTIDDWHVIRVDDRYRVNRDFRFVNPTTMKWDNAGATRLVKWPKVWLNPKRTRFFYTTGGVAHELPESIRTQIAGAFMTRCDSHWVQTDLASLIYACTDATVHKFDSDKTLGKWGVLLDRLAHRMKRTNLSKPFPDFDPVHYTSVPAKAQVHAAKAVHAANIERVQQIARDAIIKEFDESLLDHYTLTVTLK